ncbi:MAG: hypothetical protein WCG62_00005 [Actinomycetes bacterium]
MKFRNRARVDWSRKSQEWLDVNLLSVEQASAITRFEEARIAAARVPSYGAPLSPLAEVMAYVAMLFTVSSGSTLVLQSFRTTGMRLTALGLVAMAALALGSRVMRLGGNAWIRIGGALLAFATACATGFVALALTRYAKLSDQVVSLLTSTFLTALSIALWRNRDRFLQMVTTVVGIFWFVGSVLAVSGVSLPRWLATLLIWAGGMVIVLFRAKIHPSSGALTVGWVICLGAAPSLLFDPTVPYLLGVLAGIATSALAVVMSHFGERRVLFFISVFALLGNLIRLFGHFAHSQVGLVVVFLVSLGAIVLIVVRFISSQTVVAPPPVQSDVHDL